MELGHALAQLPERTLYLLLDAVERFSVPVTGGRDVEAGGQQVLDRFVVQGLGDPPPLALLGLDRLGHQAAALGGERADAPLAGGQQPHEDRARERDQCRSLWAVELHQRRSPRRMPSATAAARSETP